MTEALEIKVAVMQNDIKYIKDSLDKQEKCFVDFKEELKEMLEAQHKQGMLYMDNKITSSFRDIGDVRYAGKVMEERVQNLVISVGKIKIKIWKYGIIIGIITSGLVILWNVFGSKITYNL